MIAINHSYLNKSPNHGPRPPGVRPSFVIWHETAGSAYSSLEWGLDPKARVSWHYLIARDGTIYGYLSPRLFTAWHAGESEARGYVSSKKLGKDEVNEHSIGVEVEGPNDGTPITTQQRDSIIALMRYFEDEFSIPLDRAYHLSHKEVARPKGRKSDPRGFSVDVALQLAKTPPSSPPRAPSPDLTEVDRLLAEAQQALGAARAAVEQLKKEGKP